MFSKKYRVSYIVEVDNCINKCVNFDELIYATCIEEVIFKIKAKVEKLKSKVNIDFTKIELVTDDNYNFREPV